MTGIVVFIIMACLSLIALISGIVLITGDEKACEDSKLIFAISFLGVLFMLLSWGAGYSALQKEAIANGAAHYEGSVDAKTGDMNSKFVWLTKPLVEEKK